MTKGREYEKYPNLSIGEGLKTGKNLAHVVVECPNLEGFPLFLCMYRKPTQIANLQSEGAVWSQIFSAVAL